MARTSPLAHLPILSLLLTLSLFPSSVLAIEANQTGLTLGSNEFEMSSESAQRSLLPATLYISYAALLADSVPCSQRGASYYDCQPGEDANPYTRGCSAITRCAR